MFRGAIVIIFSIMALSLSVFAEAQSLYPAQTSSLKNDGRFIAKLGTDDRQDVISANGLVESLDVEIEWWGLIGQAVEIYGIRWQRGSSYNLSGATLSRLSLGKYPDLVTRFDDLKPINIEVTFDVELFSEGHDDERKYDQVFNASFGPTYYKSGRAVATKTTDNFLIAESGKMMRDLSPSSPGDWQSFIDISSYHATQKNGDQNVKTQNTFKAAQKIVFKNLRITKIDLPDASARAIYAEFEKREKKEEDKENCEEKNNCNEGEDLNKNNGDDFWGDENTSTRASSDSVENDDFWGDSKPSIRNKSKSNDGFWGEASAGSKKSSGSNDAFWGDSINELNKSKADFKIKKNDNGQQGVVSSTGKVLIPFRDWRVVKFRGGLALIRESKGRTLLSRIQKGRKRLGGLRNQCDDGTFCKYRDIYLCVYENTNAEYWVNKQGVTVSEVTKNTFKTHKYDCSK